ncbi:MAG TPA: hypothetical protein DCR44_08305 [Acholeplasmatales bacterium]|nr:MAG: hypothetical protein A2Y16_02915 [Tenericutes bacterium GWF2_57_13]HAQ57368.1 hypothetical protein [Acholeplasmatales bacterium]
MSLKRFPVSLLFIAVETALIAGFLFFTEGVWTRAFQFAAIVLSAVHSLYRFRPTTDRVSATAGLMFTVAADLFLVVLGPFRVLALSLFCVAQLFHAVRLSSFDCANHRTIAILRGSTLLLFIAVALFVTVGRFDPLAILAAVYAALLFTNAGIALTIRKRDPFAFPGFLLFILCDLFIFLAVGTDQGYFVLEQESIWALLSGVPFNLAWLFYAPSQVLLSLGAVYARPEVSR